MKWQWPLTSSDERDDTKAERDNIANTSVPIPVIGDYVSMPPESQHILDRAQSLISTTEGKIMLGSACAISFAVGFKAGRIQPAWRRFTQVSEISDVGPNAPFLRGRVLSVSDGDTIRFLHSPTIFSHSRLRDGEKLSETALPIRIATIDTPEVAKFGKPGQPFGEEAKEYLSSMIGDKIVKARLLSKDQYGRAVAQVTKPGIFGRTDVDEEMLKAGLAEVYRGGGAVYGHKGKEAYIQMEEAAKKSKKGMWSDGNRESAAEFKARMKAEG